MSHGFYTLRSIRLGNISEGEILADVGELDGGGQKQKQIPFGNNKQKNDKQENDKQKNHKQKKQRGRRGVVSVAGLANVLNLQRLAIAVGAIVEVCVLPLLVLPPLMLEISLAAGKLFACFAVTELFAAAEVVAVSAIAVAIGVAVAVVVNDIGGGSELDADCELLCLRGGWIHSHECACCEASHHQLCNPSLYICDLHKGLLTPPPGPRACRRVFRELSARGRVVPP